MSIHNGHGNLCNIVTLTEWSESKQLNVYPRLWFSWDLAVASSLLAHICLYIGLKNHYHSECLSTVIVSHWAVKRREQSQWMAVWISIVSDLREEEKEENIEADSVWTWWSREAWGLLWLGRRKVQVQVQVQVQVHWVMELSTLTLNTWMQRW